MKNDKLQTDREYFAEYLKNLVLSGAVIEVDTSTDPDYVIEIRMTVNPRQKKAASERARKEKQS